MARRRALFLSLAAGPSLLSSTRMTALAFTSAFDTSRAGCHKKRFNGVVADGTTRLFYATDEDAAAISIADAAHIDDSTHHSILNNPLGQPVLVDCYTNNCGPCKLLERSLKAVLPKYADNLLFCKWDTDEKESSQQFMDLIREHDMTFRKLPTLILFVDGVPVAVRSGMATAGQLESFLMENMPKDLPSLFVPTLRRRNAGGV